MKKIILIDPAANIFKEVLSSKSLIIDTLILSNPKQLVGIEMDSPPNSFLFRDDGLDEFYINHCQDIDYDLLGCFKHIELKVVSYFERFTSDIGRISYIYSCALSYWIDKLKDNSISGVFCNEIEHGSIHDTIILEVARYYNKKVYISTVGFSNAAWDTLDSIYDFVSNKFIVLSIEDKSNKVNINDFIYNSEMKDTVRNLNSKKDFSIKGFIVESIERFFGTAFSIYFFSFFGRYKSNVFGFCIPAKSYYSGSVYCKLMKKYYASISKIIDPQHSYIYYSLHMEPEASIQNNTIFSNQLAIIKDLHDNLPDGWFLYIKEHPHQYDLDNKEFSYFLPSIKRFRTKGFYKEILKLKNSRLINLKVSSKVLIEKSKAVATINGTVVIEAIKSKKPVLTYAQNTTPLAYIEDVFDISKSSETRSSIMSISNGFSPSYSDFDDVVSNYYHAYNSKLSNNKEDFVRLIERLF